MRHQLLHFGGRDTAFSTWLLCELGTAVTNCSTLKLLSELMVNSSHFTAYRHHLLFPDGEVELDKHGSIVSLIYENPVSTVLGHCSTGNTTAKGSRCPGCFVLKCSSDQLLALIENSLQLERHVHGLPLISSKDRYSVTEKHTTSAFGSHQRPIDSSVQEEKDWWAVGSKLPFV